MAAVAIDKIYDAYGPPGASVTTTIMRQMQKDKAVRGHPFLEMG